MEEAPVVEETIDASEPARVISHEDVLVVWKEFAELRKNQIAEYTLLKKDFQFDGIAITVTLSNQFEEPLLLNIRVQLIAYLRNKLNHNSLTVKSVLEETDTKKIAYTDKEKFDLLASKNPALRELKERLGLDTDF